MYGVWPLAILFFILFFGVYLLPTEVVFLRNGRNKLNIVTLNIFLGWTIIGWVIALAFAARSRSS